MNNVLAVASIRHDRSSATRFTHTTDDARRWPKFISTIRSVPPASTVASGTSASAANASDSEAGTSTPPANGDVVGDMGADFTIRQARTRVRRARRSLDRDVLEARLGQRHLRVERLERLEQDPRDGEVAQPVPVGRNDEPRRVLGRRLLDRVRVRTLVLVPQGAVLQVRGAELPVLLRIVEAFLQTLRLLFLGDMEEALDDARALVG